jgi:hypothetical protein
MFLLQGVGQAAYLTTWTNQPYSPITDADDGVAPSYFEILKEWYQEEAGSAYFRLDLEAAPPSAATDGDTWGVYIDAKPGGTSTNVAPGLSGIDYRVLLTWSDALTDYIPQWKKWTGAAWANWYATGTDHGFQSTENSGTTLEWFAPTESWAGGITAFGATFNGATPYDQSKLVTPEPSVLSLFGIGLGAVCLRRRRHSR